MRRPLINGTHTATFAIDTGSDTSLLTDVCAKEIGLTTKPYLENDRPFTIAGKPISVAVASTLQIGQLSITTVPLAVVPGKELSSLFNMSIDGLIGTNVLTYFAVAFDFPQHQITIWYPGGLPDAIVKGAGFVSPATLPLTTPKSRYLYAVTAQFRQSSQIAKESMIVDTGAGVTVIARSLAQTLKLASQQSVKTGSLLGDAVLEQSVIDSVSLGPLEALNRTVSYPSQKEINYPEVLGMDILSGYRVLLDFPSKKMYLAPPASVAPPVRIKSSASAGR